MRFKSPQEMYDFVADGDDIYSPSAEMYIFLYNDTGSLCAYRMSLEEAKSLQSRCVNEDDCWSDFLGPGGLIYDTLDYEEKPVYDKAIEDLCAPLYKEQWVICSEVAKL